MIVHLFTRLSGYSSEFIRVLTEHYDPKQHVIVFRNEHEEVRKQIDYNIKMLFLAARKDFITQN